MELWMEWWSVVSQFRPACGRLRTFLRFSACMAGMTVRSDLRGATSIVRALGLKESSYDRILDFFHSKALDLEVLTRTWVELRLKIHPAVLRVNGRLLLVGDGIKAPKSGRKMPAVRLLHQESESNTKPAYIMGHSLQAVAILAGAFESVFAVPLASNIHEGVVFSNRDKRTLLYKMVLLLGSLTITDPFYFIAYGPPEEVEDPEPQGDLLLAVDGARGRLHSLRFQGQGAEPDLFSVLPGAAPPLRSGRRRRQVGNGIAPDTADKVVVPHEEAPHDGAGGVVRVGDEVEGVGNGE